MNITKKLIAILMVFVLTAVIIPFSVINVSAETVSMGYIFEDGVNIRADATTSSEKIAQVSEWHVTVLGRKNDVNKVQNPKTNKTYVWFKITYVNQSKTITGYVREDLIKVTKYTIDPDFKATLSAFPESYHNDLIVLHAMYPNWKFVADEVGLSFTSAVALEDKEYIKLVESNNYSWRSMRNKCYDWKNNKFIATDGSRYGASTEVISYYMDPRNFLNANDVYMYMLQSYDANTQTIEGVKSLLKGTYLEGNVTDKNDKYYGKPYAGVIRYAASQSGVNAYVLASTIIMENGTKGTSLSKGYTFKSKTVYNHFNFGASGTTTSDIIYNGAKYAYDNQWFTPTASIVGGAKKYGSGYIAVGQNTYFYKNYNILNSDRIWHQYAQNVADSLSSSRKLKSNYTTLYDMALTFRIPVYTSMPAQISKLPEASNKLNNYYFEDININGLSPTFNRYTNKYTASVSGNTTLTYTLPSGATYVGQAEYTLKKGKNTVKLNVKSQTGYTRTYTLTVTASKNATLTVMQSGTTLKKGTDGKWYYYVNGKKSQETTLVNYSGKWFYIENGIWNKTANTLVKYAGKWFYIEEGKWNQEATKLFKYNNKWFYIKNGKWASSAETLVKHSDKWFYVKNGKWTTAPTLIFNYNGKDFYVKAGKVDLTYTGTATIGDSTYNIVNGKVVS